jgi:hypothetical protein
VPPEGNFRIMSPYVMVFRGVGIAGTRCRRSTAYAPYKRTLTS